MVLVVEENVPVESRWTSDAQLRQANQFFRPYNWKWFQERNDTVVWFRRRICDENEADCDTHVRELSSSYFADEDEGSGDFDVEVDGAGEISASLKNTLRGGGSGNSHASGSTYAVTGDGNRLGSTGLFSGDRNAARFIENAAGSITTIGDEIAIALGMNSLVWWRMGVDFVPPLSNVRKKVAQRVKMRNTPPSTSSSIEPASPPGQNGTAPTAASGEAREGSLDGSSSAAAADSTAHEFQNVLEHVSTSWSTTSRPVVPTYEGVSLGGNSSSTIVRLRRKGWAAFAHSFRTVFSLQKLKSILMLPWRTQEESFASMFAANDHLQADAIAPGSSSHDALAAGSSSSTTTRRRRRRTGGSGGEDQTVGSSKSVKGSSRRKRGSGSERLDDGRSDNQELLHYKPPHRVTTSSSTATFALEEATQLRELNTRALTDADSDYRQGEDVTDPDQGVGDLGVDDARKIPSQSSFAELVDFSQRKERMLRVQRLERFGGQMRSLHTQFLHLFQHTRELGINLYYSPKIENAQQQLALEQHDDHHDDHSPHVAGGGGQHKSPTLGPHSDDMDEFILQVRGYKQWKFADNTTLVMAPGDSLFVPKNTWHSLSALPGYESAHLAIGVQESRGRRGTVGLGKHGAMMASGDFYFSVPPTEKSTLEFMQEEPWAVFSLLLAYCVQAFLIIVLAMCCIDRCVTIDPDQGGRGSTVRSRRLFRKRLCNGKGSKNADAEGGGGEGRLGDEDSGDEDESTTSSTIISSDGFRNATSSWTTSNRTTNTIGNRGKSRGDQQSDVELMSGASSSSSSKKSCASSPADDDDQHEEHNIKNNTSAAPCTPTSMSTGEPSLVELNARVQELSRRLASGIAEQGDDVEPSRLLPACGGLKEQYYELQRTLQVAEEQEARFRWLRRRAAAMASSADGDAPDCDSLE
ncbi:unnamed protein product [Amoebophrya sp. A25]|nr:unnamed protein product [Amoebophrya sp. A25]|eukprot:GSA25T00010015001.1